MDINIARGCINSYLSGCILYLENPHPDDYLRNALSLIRTIGFIAGRTNAPFSPEMRILHKMGDALYVKDLTKLWAVQDEWCEWCKYRKMNTAKRERTSSKIVDKGNSGVQSGGTG